LVRLALSRLEERKGQVVVRGVSLCEVSYFRQECHDDLETPEDYHVEDSNGLQDDINGSDHGGSPTIIPETRARHNSEGQNDSR